MGRSAPREYGTPAASGRSCHADVRERGNADIDVDFAVEGIHAQVAILNRQADAASPL